MQEITDRRQLEAIKTQLRMQIETFDAEIQRLSDTKKRYQAKLSDIFRHKRYTPEEVVSNVATKQLSV